MTASTAHETGLPSRRRLEGKIAVVTAAAGAIGSAIAARLVQDGAAAVLLLDRDPRVAEVASAIGAFESVCLGFQVDCSDDSQVRDTFEAIASRFGRVDVLVNGVGGGTGNKAVDFCSSTPDAWRRIIESTLVSAMLCARQVAPGMRDRKYGKIVNIASSVALAPAPNLVDYASAKSGILGFTRALALELAPFHVNVNTVSPGPINTPSFRAMPDEMIERSRRAIPMGFIGEAADVANAVAFLACDESRYITGQNLAVNGGRVFS